MDSGPQLSTIASSLDDLTRRITGLADSRAEPCRDDAVASELYEIERALQHALAAAATSSSNAPEQPVAQSA